MKVERITVAPDFEISRIIKGGWQLSQGHGTVGEKNPVEDMFAFAEAGITTFDCADIYTGVEELIGKFLKLRKERLGYNHDIKVLTKFVPDYDDLATIDKRYIEKIIDLSLKRLGQERLDMVQFSWWAYDIPGWVETAHWLDELRQAGKINLISATNFNTKHTREIVESGVNLATLQVQYSLLDNRPEQSLSQLCEDKGMYMLCYGTVAGGFFSDRWLGVAEPQPPFENRSLVKYKLMIEEFGGWELFQELLKAMKIIADKHNVKLTNIATRYILDNKQIGGVIIGAKTIDHLQDNLKTFDFQLDQQDYKALNAVLSQRQKLDGDVFDIERIKDGPHGSIMKYNLNKQSS